ncbi:MAG: 50S ribosomal protein L10 [Planctomycetota bacterium]
MSKLVKDLITESYKRKFVDRDGVVVVHLNAIEGTVNTEMRNDFAQKGMRVTIVKNSQAKRAIEGTPLEPVGEVLDGPCAFVYSIDADGSVVNIARQLMDEKKGREYLEIKGAVMEGSLFGDAKQVEALSKYPTREEAVGKLVGALLGPASMLSKTMTDQGANLAGALKGTAGKAAALLKAVEDKGGELKKSA